jgi:hypothetical protein
MLKKQNILNPESTYYDESIDCDGSSNYVSANSSISNKYLVDDRFDILSNGYSSSDEVFDDYGYSSHYNISTKDITPEISDLPSETSDDPKASKGSCNLQ